MINLRQETIQLKTFTLELASRLFRPHTQHWNMIIIGTLRMIRTCLVMVILSSLFVGGILVVVFQHHISFFRADSILGAFASSALLREVGPLLVGFLLSGQCGAYVASEIATMKATDQLDTLSSLGLSDMDLVIVPRFVSIFMATTFSLMLSLAGGIVGAYLVAASLYDMSIYFFFSKFQWLIQWSSLWSGFYKCFAFGSAIAFISCYTSYTAEKSVQGVSTAVQKTAIRNMMALIILDTFTTHTFRGLMFVLKYFGVLS